MDIDKIYDKVIATNKQVQEQTCTLQDIQEYLKEVNKEMEIE